MNRQRAITGSGPYLNGLYNRLNRREYVSPDPLEFLYRYDDPRDREIVGLVASSLAYGRVEQICAGVASVLEGMGDSPSRFVVETSSRSLQRAFGGFQHRWTTGKEMGLMMVGVRQVIERYGSLGACFRAGMGRGDATVLPALSFFVRELSGAFRGRRSSLLPILEKGSACKRLHLYLRWMVRRDEVDPGVWSGIPASRLLVPLDTHMHRMCRRLGLTRRRQANLRTVLEVTAAFREIAPDDPVRYDFALTRLGIRRDFKTRSKCGKTQIGG